MKQQARERKKAKAGQPNIPVPPAPDESIPGNAPPPEDQTA
jgi:hypothetical protein